MIRIPETRPRAILLACLALSLAAACTRPTPRSSPVAASLPAPADAIAPEGGSSSERDFATLEPVPPEARRIEIEPGAGSTVVTGTIEAEGEQIYVLSAQAGRKMLVGLRGEPAAAVIDDHPEGCEDCVAFEIAAWEDWDWQQSGIEAWAGELPVDGDYYIRVFSILAPYAKDYRLEIDISEAMPDAEGSRPTGGPGREAARRDSDRRLPRPG